MVLEVFCFMWPYFIQVAFLDKTILDPDWREYESELCGHVGRDQE